MGASIYDLPQGQARQIGNVGSIYVVNGLGEVILGLDAVQQRGNLQMGARCDVHPILLEDAERKLFQEFRGEVFMRRRQAQYDCPGSQTFTDLGDG